MKVSEFPLETSIVVVPQESSKPIMRTINSPSDKFYTHRWYITRYWYIIKKIIHIKKKYYINLIKLIPYI